MIQKIHPAVSFKALKISQDRETREALRVFFPNNNNLERLKDICEEIDLYSPDDKEVVLRGMKSRLSTLLEVIKPEDTKREPGSIRDAFARIVVQNSANDKMGKINSFMCHFYEHHKETGKAKPRPKVDTLEGVIKYYA